MTPPAVCEVCGQPLTVETGDEGTSCHWCQRYKVPRAPAGETGTAQVAPTGRPILRLSSGRGIRKVGSPGRAVLKRRG